MKYPALDWGIISGRLWLTSILSIWYCVVQAGGIRGIVTDQQGTPMPYAAIYVKQTNSGTTTNESGYYEIKLSPGTYDVIYQYTGYSSQTLRLVVAGEYVTTDVKLEPVSLSLKELVVKPGKEDPAYTIMRKTIAKAGYYRNQPESYTARVYMKGTGVLNDYPWWSAGLLKKEGIEKDQAFVSESISEIRYERPDSYHEKVIAVRSKGESQNISPMTYIRSSFYEPMIGQVTSPLSPRAFIYYRFKLEGTYTDREYLVSRIKVIPRVKGDNLFSGTIDIVQDWWCLHSVDLTTAQQGVSVNINSVFAPVEDKVWLPVSHKFNIRVKLIGFEMYYRYFASVSDYSIELNREIYIEPGSLEVIDDKLEESIEEKDIEDDEGSLSVAQQLNSRAEITRKDLRKMLKAYERESLKKEDDPEVISVSEVQVDSAAYIADSAYWAATRPVPLDSHEISGYRKQDSLFVLRQEKQDSSLIKRNGKFSPTDLLLGNRYRLTSRSALTWHMPDNQFNAVEGYNLTGAATYTLKSQDTSEVIFRISPYGRYGFARKKFAGYITTTAGKEDFNITLRGGKYVWQFNDKDPVQPSVNTFTSLLLGENFIKLYESDFAALGTNIKVSPFVKVTAEGRWARRRELQNSSGYSLFGWPDEQTYTPNQPENPELSSTGFPEHHALVSRFETEVQPWMKFRIRDGKRIAVEGSSPIFTFSYSGGFYVPGFSEVRFGLVEAGIRHRVRLGLLGEFQFRADAGIFTHANSLYFMDFKHFSGNQTPFISRDPLSSFRLLDYYQFSTREGYFSANLYHQFRRFLLTNITLVRFSGIREGVTAGYLMTPTLGNYVEGGYVLDGIFRFFRVEASAGFRDFRYTGMGLRVGITVRLN